MNLIKRIFTKDVWNAPILNKLDNENNQKLSKLRTEIQEKIGYDIDDCVIKTVATRRLLECYDADEIIEVLSYYALLK